MFSTPKPDRRKGFSNRATAAIFVATVINFILSSVNTGIQVARLVVAIRLAPIPDISHPLLEKPELKVSGVFQNMDIVAYWTKLFPVSIWASCCRWITYLFMLGGGTAQ